MAVQKTMTGGLYVPEMSSNAGGIYMIVNLLRGEAYVGQAKKFLNRTHQYDLKEGLEGILQGGSQLQAAYDNGDTLLYIPIDAKVPEGRLNDYEQFYMYTARDELHFKLYNQTWRASIPEPKDAGTRKKELFQRLSDCFGSEITDLLLKAETAEREQAVERCIKYLGENPLVVPYFSKKELEEEYQMKEISLEALAPEKLIVSSLGSYIGDTVGKILDFESKAIKKWGYCLWMFGQQINTKLGRAFCQEIVDGGGTPYVLLRYTHTSTGNERREAGQRYIFPVFETKGFEALPEDVKQDLKVIKSAKDGKYRVPGYEEDGQDQAKRFKMDCSAKEKSNRAFVVERMDYVSECIVLEKFFEGFSVITADPPKKRDSSRVKFGRVSGYMSDSLGSFTHQLEDGKRVLHQRTTGCIQLKDQTLYQKLPALVPEKRDSTNYILLTLKAPYIIEFDENEKYPEPNELI